MEISKTNIDCTDRREIYRMTKGTSLKVSEMEKDVTLPVDKWAIYEEEKTDSKGETKVAKILSVVSAGMKFSTNSATFINSFEDIADIMQDEPFAIILRSGTTKAGRTYQDCELDCDWRAEA
jgi:hypothetical protein